MVMRPIFYLVPVTEALSVAVATGQYPEARTTVSRCITSLGHDRRISEGMETPGALLFSVFSHSKTLRRRPSLS
ncbi:uncharacterized protein BJ212DRAFT_1317535, partial [Suillus subaureus]